jgi:transcriptional regulator with XRE-family HTH domain
MDVAHRASKIHSFLPRKAGSANTLAHVDDRTKAFRDWIAAILAKLHISRTELAKQAGLSHSTLSRATSDDDYRINFRADTITKLALVGGIAPPAILTGEPTNFDGLSEPQATPYAGTPERHLNEGQSIWTCHSAALSSMGLMPGDRFILDQNQSPKPRDIIVIQHYDHQSGSAETLIRVYIDEFAVTPMYVIDGTPRIHIDSRSATVMGVLIESWRTRS